MKKLCRMGLVIALGVSPVTGDLLHAQSQTSEPAVKTENRAGMHASGPFDVKLAPQPADDKTNDPLLGRMTIDKHDHGELEATATGLMLSGGDYKSGSAGYVAMEKVSGTLQGRAGTFMLQHSGILNKGAQQLSITIVPGSGTGQLTGISGKMDVKIKEGGKHFYELEYTLPAAQ
ncbi:MAG TPA: DUF3224 domain-containing protein [Candidatus Angelobacter sp.]|nr:DUF3224 domain-containing protein [Candidatus Angelobacter sp.]